MKHYRIIRKQTGPNAAPYYICQEEHKFLWWKWWSKMKGSKWTFNQAEAEQHMQELLEKDEYFCKKSTVKEYWRE